MTKQELGRKLFQLMVGKGWNQSDLARAAQMGRDSISNYVNGKSFPTPVAREKLAKAFGMAPEELLPNGIMQAMEDEIPAVSMTQPAGYPGRAWLRINRMVTFGTAAKIVELIYEDDKRADAEA
ncbi:hypothetical protein BSL82_15875 [Tardibacter chloracetimidivorans]|uniref:HTH cro/C1-type domain-containing protein n=1 Tax=Tardibacter chloracetimidivorans TaxID=1921510 RepID=A0A1L3ZY73_9SPHN|nr:helix-turn-helix transcriptional regulator [Tardibacter chloracetimidivorans]API60584.1 hypothetical protein BSL82_15875 [Tardibacter chloracetimidivorans]